MDHFEILIKLLIAHLLGDFFFQPKRWTEKRRKYLFRSVHLYLHAAIHGLLVYIFLGDRSGFLVPLLIMLSHFLVDLGKAYIRDRPALFLIDQGLHITVICIIWIAFFGDWAMFPGLLFFFNDPLVLMVILSYLFILSPSAVLIRILTEKYQPDIQTRPAGFVEKREAEEVIGLKDAGRLIGILERVMIVSFILIQQYALIGFLIAAKSVLRYSDIKTNYDRKRVEYILIGTLLSFSIAIITGIFTLWLLKNR
ncbi:MAG: DUF3307 domain-containing protein [Bacteroidales bacterium]|nr:DUF3307 domain-containing protein [Bacteroidales bacterium]